MRITHIANEVVSTGNGIVNSAVDLACLQADAGHDVSFVSSGGGYVELLESHGVKHYDSNMYVRSAWRFMCDLPNLRKTIASLQPQIVHAHMMTGAILMRIGRKLAGFGDYGLVTTVHNEWRLTSNLMQAGDRVIVLSENGKRTFRRRGFPDRKMHVVRHGILHSPRRSEEIRKGNDASPSLSRLPIVTMAGLYKRKGIGDLIRAFGQIADEFPTASLHVLGWGPERRYFEELKSSVNGAERIELKGFVAKPHAILQKAAVFVLASHTEAFPLAVAEAREAGCAIIATNVGGIPELLDEGRAGILVPPRDPDALADALRRVLGDPAEREKWRLAARSNLDWLTCGRMSDETLAVYKDLIAERDAMA